MSSNVILKKDPINHPFENKRIEARQTFPPSNHVMDHLYDNQDSRVHI